MSFKKDHFNFPQRIFFKIVRFLMSDTAYANMSLRRWLGGGDVNNPKTFNEKLHWLKIHDRNPLYVALADKYAVREYVKERVGNHFLSDLLGMWSKVSEIDWATLPDSFVLKATHGSGMNILVKDKAALSLNKLNDQLSSWLVTDYSRFGRQWVYRGIPRRIIAERFLNDATGNAPYDYKVFCMNGEPCYIQVDVDRFGDHRRVYFDAEWQRQAFTILHEQYQGGLEKPVYLDAMLNAAKNLARGIPFVRIDFYALPKIVFGEMTFYPGNGQEMFSPPEWDLRLGQMLELPIRGGGRHVRGRAL